MVVVTQASRTFVGISRQALPPRDGTVSGRAESPAAPRLARLCRRRFLRRAVICPARNFASRIQVSPAVGRRTSLQAIDRARFARG